MYGNMVITTSMAGVQGGLWTSRESTILFSQRECTMDILEINTTMDTTKSLNQRSQRVREAKDPGQAKETITIRMDMLKPCMRLSDKAMVQSITMEHYTRITGSMSSGGCVSVGYSGDSDFGNHRRKRAACMAQIDSHNNFGTVCVTVHIYRLFVLNLTSSHQSLS